MPATARQIDIRLPHPHAKQAEILRSKAKRQVICAGRRAGKTTLAARVAIKKAFASRRVLLSSTTQDQADAFWEKCKAWLSEAIQAGLIEKNESRRILTFPKGGRIKVKTARDADGLRGDYADFLVLDECALLDPDAWDKVGAPMLLDNDGNAWFISTPRRRNWFFQLYQRGLDDDPRWVSWHFTSFDNPHLSPSALEEITKDLTDEAYRQEILAEFLEGEGQVFRNIYACLTAPLNAKPSDHEGHRVVMGVDWAQKADFTCLSVFCSNCAVECELDRFNKIEWAFQRGRLRALADKWKVGLILAEENSIGNPNIEALQREGLYVRPFTTTAASKPPLIQSLALAFEKQEARWLSIPVATGELEAFESKVSPNTGRVSYGAPEGGHDDSVIARALAWQAVTTGEFRQWTFRR